MSSLIQISDLSRRDMLRRIAMALTAAGAGSLDLASAQHVHGVAAEEKKQAGGVYTPKVLTAHEYKTVTRLAELIVPADDKSGSAVDAGAPEFIDLLCSQNEKLTRIYSSGILWLDDMVRRHHDKTFVDLAEQQQIAVLDMLVAEQRARREKLEAGGGENPNDPYPQFRDYQVEKEGDLGPGVSFFEWVRKMSVDAYYTSPMGIKDVGYMGNTALSEYKVPQEAIDYAMKHSPFGSSSG